SINQSINANKYKRLLKLCTTKRNKKGAFQLESPFQKGFV
ncbi:MAG: hypothetical protein ACJAX8_001870, partial [Flavobacteriales bacterium]